MSNLRDAHFARRSVSPPKSSPLRQYVSVAADVTSPSSKPLANDEENQPPPALPLRRAQSTPFSRGRRLDRFGNPMRTKLKRNRPLVPLRILIAKKIANRSRHADSSDDEDDDDDHSKGEVTRKSKLPERGSFAALREARKARSKPGGKLSGDEEDTEREQKNQADGVASDQTDDESDDTTSKESDIEDSEADDDDGGAPLDEQARSYDVGLLEMWLRNGTWPMPTSSSVAEGAPDPIAGNSSTMSDREKSSIPENEETSERRSNRERSSVPHMPYRESYERIARRRMAPTKRRRPTP